MPENAQIPLFIDCDTGIDDALALAYVLAEPAIKLVGVGTVFGNIDASVAADNTLALLHLAGRSEVPVAIGARNPLVGTFGGGAPHVHGSNGIGDVRLDAAPGAVVDEPASDLLARLAVEAGGSLRVLALGPLTNLAHFLDEHPESVSLIAEVIVMGGAFSRPGNVTPFAEANIHNDPEAAARVFAADWPVTVLALDITMEHVLTEQQAIELGNIPGDLPPTLTPMLGKYFEAYQQIYGARQCALHDPLAAVVAAGRATVVMAEQPERISVVAHGEERGRTIAHASFHSTSAFKRSILREIREDTAQILLDTIARHPWPSQP